MRRVLSRVYAAVPPDCSFVSLPPTPEKWEKRSCHYHAPLTHTAAFLRGFATRRSLGWASSLLGRACFVCVFLCRSCRVIWGPRQRAIPRPALLRAGHADIYCQKIYRSFWFDSGVKWNYTLSYLGRRQDPFGSSLESPGSSQDRPGSSKDCPGICRTVLGASRTVLGALSTVLGAPRTVL